MIEEEMTAESDILETNENEMESAVETQEISVGMEDETNECTSDDEDRDETSKSYVESTTKTQMTTVGAYTDDKEESTTSKMIQTTTSKPTEPTTEYIEPYLNHTSIEVWNGGAVWSGMYYEESDNTNYAEFFIELHVYGVDNSKVKWSSANEKIAKVKDGVVTPGDYGKTTITAEVNGKKLTCSVNVKMICPYFYVDYSNTVDDISLTNGRKDCWIWNSWFCANKGDTIKYKITEKEYDEHGNFVVETDITDKVKLLPFESGTVQIQENNGTILPLKAKEDGSFEVRGVLSKFDTYRYEGSQKSFENKLEGIYMRQMLVMELTIKEKGMCDQDMIINLRYGHGADGFLALEPKEFVGMFTWDDQFFCGASWYYLSAPLDELTWSSSDENVIEIGEAVGSGYNYYCAVRYKIKNSGITTITVKRGDKVVDKVKVQVDEQSGWCLLD